MKLIRAVGAVSAVVAAGVILVSAANVDEKPDTTLPPVPTAAPIETPEAAPIEGTTAVSAFEDFVARAHQGDSGRALALMANELPDVLGLGTAQYPTLADAGLWEDGRLDRRRAEQFIDEISALDGDVIVYDCAGFGDGPRVIITRCSYSLFDGSQSAEESGQLFGVMVEDKVAGLIQKAAEKDEGTMLRRGRSGATRI